MKSQTALDDEDGARYLKLIRQGTDIGRHVELLRWLQGDVQHYLPHEILLAGWGDFEEGCVQHDIVSALPGVRSYALGTEVLPFLLAKVRDRWVAERRGPCTFDFQEFRYLLGQASLPDSFCHSLHGMRSALVHGIADAREQAARRSQRIPPRCRGGAARLRDGESKRVTNPAAEPDQPDQCGAS